MNVKPKVQQTETITAAPPAFEKGVTYSLLIVMSLLINSIVKSRS